MKSIFKDSMGKKDLIIKVIVPTLLLFGFIWWMLGFNAFLVLSIITLIFIGTIKLGFMIMEEKFKEYKK